MDVLVIALFLITGSFGGWLAGLAARGRGLGMIGNPLLGVVGAFAGAIVFDAMDAGVVITGFGVLFASFVATALVLSLVDAVRKWATSGG